MKKVKNIYFDETYKIRSDSNCFTGLILEMDDGTFYKNYSTDPLQQWQEVAKKDFIV